MSPLRLALLLTVLAAAGGCRAIRVAKTAKKVLVEDTSVSLTVKGDEVRLERLTVDLRSLPAVHATVKAVKTGVRVVEIVGVYADVIETLHWMTRLGLEIVANSEASAALLQVAFALASA